MMMTMSFYDDDAFQSNLAPKRALIYEKVFGPIKSIKAANWTSKSIENVIRQFEDKEQAIDIEIEFQDGVIINLQEKSRRWPKFNAPYNDFTIEYMNDPKTKDVGELFKIKSMYYFSGQANKNGDDYVNWVIYKTKPLIKGILKNWPIETMIKNGWLNDNNAYNKANFFAIKKHLIEENIPEAMCRKSIGIWTETKKFKKY